MNRTKIRPYYPLHYAIARDCDPGIIEALLAHGAEFERATAVKWAKDPQLKNGPRYLEILGAASPRSAAGR